jgi:hypothetical protein
MGNASINKKVICNDIGVWCTKKCNDKHLEAMGEDYHCNNPCKMEVE